MTERSLDSRIVYRGVLSGTLIPAQGAALFRQNKESAGYYLNDRLTETLDDPAYKDGTDLDSPPGRFMEMYWLVFGAETSVVQLTLHKGPLVDCFFRQKMMTALESFCDGDMRLLENRYRDLPMREVVANARARKLAPLADVLLKNPAELNGDIADLKQRLSAYDFNPGLNAALDKVESGLAAGGDPFDQAALLKHLRTFFEKLHEQAGQTLQARKPEAIDGTPLHIFGKAADFLFRKDVLTEKLLGLAKSLYGVLSNEGVHALTSEREYVRLCRNMVAEYALVLFFELDRRVK